MCYVLWPIPVTEVRVCRKKGCDICPERLLIEVIGTCGTVYRGENQFEPHPTKWDRGTYHSGFVSNFMCIIILILGPQASPPVAGSLQFTVGLHLPSPLPQHTFCWVSC